jgi:hypothetical protein
MAQSIKVNVNPNGLEQSIAQAVKQTHHKTIMKSLQYYLEKYANPINAVAYSVSLYIVSIVLMDWIRFITS